MNWKTREEIIETLCNTLNLLHDKTEWSLSAALLHAETLFFRSFNSANDLTGNQFQILCNDLRDKRSALSQTQGVAVKEETANVNQIIHERLMGECWHEKGERSKDDFYKNYCSKCGKLASFYTCNEGVVCDQNPTYDSDFNKCFAAQAKAIERFGAVKYVNAVGDIILNDPNSVIYWVGCLTLSVKQRCAAIVKLLENEK